MQENPVVGFTCNGVPIRKSEAFRSLVQKPKEESEEDKEK